MGSEMCIRDSYYSVRDDENRREATLALRRARSYLRRKLGERLGLRLVPEIKFLYDDSLEQQQRLDSIFKEIELQRIKQTIMQTAEEDSDMSEEQYDS